VADIDQAVLTAATGRYGFATALIPESGRLPFDDRAFDIVFCSSVIEHVTVAKSEVWDVTDGRAFAKVARRRQAEFAAELTRIGDRYFVQAPYRWFPLEPHTWLPFFSYLPRPAQIRVMRWSNRFWIKQTTPSFHLPTTSEFRRLFPEAEIKAERIGRSPNR